MARVTLQPGQSVLLENGSAVQLGEAFAAGREGRVFHLPAMPKYCAKLYFNPNSAEKARKLTRMIELSSPALQKNSAWPLTRILDKRSGLVLGFVMRRLEGYRPLHSLYTPLTRKQEFPHVTWRFLIHTAANLAAAVGTVHQAGCVVGDMNQGNGLFHPQTAQCTLIDCDSFQVPDGAYLHRCEVGVAHFTPPELQGQGQFANLTRTVDHDAFTLAMLIFHLLFCGRHPFFGVSHSKHNVMLADQIKGFRFAYSERRGTRCIPPGAPALTVLDAATANLFEQAFSAEYVGRRPRAAQWMHTLRELGNSLRTCADEPAHRYAQHLRGCPWCALERSAGVIFFVGNTPAQLLTDQDFDPQPLGRQLRRLLRWPAYSMSASKACAPRMGAANHEQRTRYSQLLERRKTLRAQGKRLRVEQQRHFYQYEQLAAEYRQKTADLASRAAREVLARELPKMIVGICYGVGVGTLAKLRKYGISHLVHLERSRLLGVPSLSARAIDALLRQRADIEKQLSSSSVEHIPPAALRAANREIRVKRAALEQELKRGIQTLIDLQREYAQLNDKFGVLLKELSAVPLHEAVFGSSVPRA
jgi:DNA-binding helix-hairpin-helix protein with protein kinase domain